MSRKSPRRRKSISLIALCVAVITTITMGNAPIALAADFTVDTIVGPTGSGQFGEATFSSNFNQNVVVLANGNIVISDPGFDLGGVLDVGAVHVYEGNTLERLSTLTGQTTGDRVGITIYPLIGSSNFVVSSPTWDRGATNSAGAVTWINGSTGLPHGETANQAKSYTVSITNSLVGNMNVDVVGSGGVTALTNGNYVVSSPRANVGIATDNGAASWGNGTTGTAGAVSMSNSLIGSSNFDRVAFTTNTHASLFIPQVNSVMGIRALPNGNYVVSSPSWNYGIFDSSVNRNTGTIDVGAVTWGNGTTGTTGLITTSNSLIGTRADDFVGNVDVNVGINGTTRQDEASTIATTNGVEVLVSGNYVVRSLLWDSATATNVGAVTWVNGSNGLPAGQSSPGAAVSVANSLIGSTASDEVGAGGVTSLANGNYVVRSPKWNTPTNVIDVGAVTHGNGLTGTVGVISTSNSLIGSATEDFVGNGGINELSNGHYVVISRDWDNATVLNAGAVTWVNGTTGKTGAVSITNSLYGTTADDRLGSFIIALVNGNYVVASENWDNSGVADVGAVTWVNGTNGHPAGETSPGAAVSTTNSLHGSTASDKIGGDRIVALTNGNYVVRSTKWNLTSPTNVNDVGAATWVNGTNGHPAGETSPGAAVSTTNSLHGSTASDEVGSPGVVALTNGNYVVRSTKWNLTSPTNVNDVGAVTWGNGATGTTGPVSTANSLHGSRVSDEIGDTGLVATPNGNYVVFSRIWDLGASTTNVGAVTWGNGATGTTGSVSTANSLHGSTTNDEVGNSSGSSASFIIPSGSQQNNLIVRSPQWDNTDTSPATANAGAITFFNTSTNGPRTTGPIATSNSVLGVRVNQYLGNTAPVRFDETYNRAYVHKSDSVNAITVITFTTAAAQTPPPAPTPDPNPTAQDSSNSGGGGISASETTTKATSTESSQQQPAAILKRSSLPQTGDAHLLTAALYAVIFALVGLGSLHASRFSHRRTNHKQ